MSDLNEAIETGKRHYVTIRNRQGKQLIKLSVLWTLLIVIAAPQLLLVVLFAVLLDLITVEYNGRPIDLEGSG